MKIAPSILSADFSKLGEQIQACSTANQIHIDVMDGRFVPAITFGLPIIRAARASTNLPLDVHLMIVEPEKHIEAVRKAGADIISVHIETSPHLHRTLTQIKNLGAKAGVAINPHTPAMFLSEVMHLLDYILVMTVNPGAGGQEFLPETLPKIRKLRMLAEEQSHAIDIGVDGGIDFTTIKASAEAGANVFIAGSAIFGSEDIPGAIKTLRDGLV